MTPINERFYSVYLKLKEKNLVKNQIDFAQKIGSADSLLTEVKKDRMNVGVDTLQKAVKKFPFISCNWILSEVGGPFLYNQENIKSNLVAESQTDYDRKVQDIEYQTEKNILMKTIQNLNERVEELKAENARLKSNAAKKSKI